MPPFDFVGPYELGEKLGQGGMGSVYRAVHAKSKEAVAVKIIAAQVADEPRFRRRFDAEIKTLMSLQHPGIVKLIGFGEEHGQLFYSMELVEGDSLQSVIKREKKLTWQQCIDFTIEICAALKHAHDVGVIHRDLKPANLIVTSDQHLKLVDFGIAKIFGDQQQTVVGSMLGTLDYMAPEQVDSSSITVRTDLYAVGSVMYAMLTGRPPFRGKNATQVLDMLKNQPPVRLDLIDPDIPEPLVELVHELLEKSPENRPPTALAVAKRLKSMRAGLEKLSRETLLGDIPSELDGHPSSAREKPTLLGVDETQATRPTDQIKSNYLPNDPHTIDSPSQPEMTWEKDSAGTQVGAAATGATLGNEELTLLGESEVSSVRQGNTLRQPSSNPPSLRTIHAPTVQTSRGTDLAAQSAIEFQTHFQEAEDARRNEKRLSSAASTSNPWPQRIGVAAMALIVLAGFFLLLQAMQPPTAEELYQSAVQQGGANAQRAFINNFPDHPKRIEIEDRLMLSQLEASRKRISTQNKIGIKQLSAAEHAFLSIFDSQQEPTTSERTESIKDWLAAFDREVTDAETQSLIQLVRYESKRLASGRADPRTDPRLADLISQIDAISQLENRKELTERLESLIDLFQNQDWASPARVRAAEILSDLKDSAEEAQ